MRSHRTGAISNLRGHRVVRFAMSARKLQGWGESSFSGRRRQHLVNTGIVAVALIAISACISVDRPNDDAQTREALATHGVEQEPTGPKAAAGDERLATRGDEAGDEALATPDDTAGDAKVATPDDAAGDDAPAPATPIDAAGDEVATDLTGAGGSGSGRASKSFSEAGGVSLSGDNLIVGSDEPSDEPNLAPAQPADAAGVDLVTLAPSNLYMSYDQGVTRTLRFAISILNQGAMPVEVQGRTDPESGEINVYQRLYTSRGTFTERFISVFVFAPGHEHWHVDDIVRYELWSAESDGARRFRVAGTTKASFCLRDDFHLNDGNHPENVPDRAIYVECEKSIQGISPGWIDFYNSGLPGQEIVIAGIPDGTYALVSTVNAGGVLHEENTDNNSAVTLFNLVGDSIVIFDQSSDARTE